MSNPADFSSYQITSSDFNNKSSCNSYDYLDKENCNVNLTKPTQRLVLQSKNSTTSALSERTDACSNRSTQDSPISYDQEQRLDRVISAQNILEYPTSSECQHTNTITYRCKYCKDCGVFIPQNGSTVYREGTYSEKLTNHPDEIYQVMLENEHKNREYLPDPLHIQFRKSITDWIFQVSEDLKLSPDTTSAIISYVDTVLSRVEVSKENLQLVILTCLILATKFLETDDKVPSFQEAYNLCQGAYSINLFKKSESFILKQLDYNLKTISPYQFVHTYLSRGCIFSTDKTVFPKVDEGILRYLRRYTECFVNLSMDDYEFNQYPSHIVACAAIGSTRKLLGITSLWCAELEELTQTSWSAIEPCFNSLYSRFEVNFPELVNLKETLVEKKPENKVEEKPSVSLLDAENDSSLININNNAAKSGVVNKKITKEGIKIRTNDNNNKPNQKEFPAKKKALVKANKESKPSKPGANRMAIEAASARIF